jgi:hypothetical protein
MNKLYIIYNMSKLCYSLQILYNIFNIKRLSFNELENMNFIEIENLANEVKTKWTNLVSGETVYLSHLIIDYCIRFLNRINNKC